MKQFPVRRAQRGITLIVALVMLVVIGLTSAAVMRGAMSSDVVANNARVQTLAQQAAQIGLRYCEAQLTLDDDVRVITIRDAAATEAEQAWQSFANWHGSGAIAEAVPESLMGSDISTVIPEKKPQCLAERSLAGGEEFFIVTARGFSPDYDEDEDTGRTITGSVVWLQSMVRLGS